MNPIDFAIVLDQMFPGENVSPRSHEVGVTYAQIASSWRGKSAIPSLQVFQSSWDTYLAAHPEYGLTGDALAKADAKSRLGSQDSTARLNRAILRVLAQFTGKTFAQTKNAIMAALDAETDPGA